MEDDRRCAIRWAIQLPVRYMGISRHIEGSCRTEDVSTTGAKLALVEKHVPGDRLNMVLDIPHSSGGSVCVEADVVWQREACKSEEECNYMTGVAFRKIRDCHKRSILDFVSTNFPQEFARRWWEGLK